MDEKLSTSVPHNPVNGYLHMLVIQTLFQNLYYINTVGQKLKSPFPPNTSFMHSFSYIHRLMASLIMIFTKLLLILCLTLLMCPFQKPT